MAAVGSDTEPSDPSLFSSPGGTLDQSCQRSKNPRQEKTKWSSAGWTKSLCFCLSFIVASVASPPPPPIETTLGSEEFATFWLLQAGRV